VVTIVSRSASGVVVLVMIMSGAGSAAGLGRSAGSRVTVGLSHDP
jgi:hypothetical protein